MALGNKIKAISEQGSAISTDYTQLFLFKGKYKKLDFHFGNFNASWNNILTVILICDKGRLTYIFPTSSNKTLMRPVYGDTIMSCDTIYEHHSCCCSKHGFTGGPSSTINESRLASMSSPLAN